jgi:hypothetical protein
MYLMHIWAARRVLAHMSWRRALEWATDNRQASLGQGARSHSSSPVSFEYPLGARQEATHGGGGSKPEERRGLAAEVQMIDRRQKTRYGGFLYTYFRIRHLLGSGDSISGFNQPLLQPVPSYRHAA